ncbi:3-oxoacyl-[acyl-carrier-protein] reductase FabG [Pseudocercospora fuligena]|uniref:3-oxoacyl-[acyl-carrier-protein] reductase FabG n=1 Tax=Pseudocercospora fuligena TaxID=685502 RepID=A0A8H6R6D1_9PEZI|nr:3-oxoacyl-[acyl-carrier-protein] reductase FabG [Pseudocercospora fuligena]
MPYALVGRNVLITGGSRGLGAEVARKFAAERCNVAINYANNEGPARDLSKELESKHGIKTTVIKGDGGVVSDVQNCVRETIKAFGGLDIIIGNAGFTKFSDFKDLDAMSYEEWDKCWHTNVTGNHALLKEALPTFNSNPDGGILIMTGSVAGKSLSGSSMAYSVTKAAQVHLMKCLANTQGPKIRVNAVLPGLLLTDWGNLYGDERINGLKNAAALKQETKLDDCAQAFVDLAKNTSVTGQAVHVDSGLVVGHM